ncbi:MAG TPA: AMP-binding protein [Pseudonocardiaceae bacterium]|nr:AMP-binding protein [Pseudonocardiaceae bacterium]
MTLLATDTPHERLAVTAHRHAGAIAVSDGGSSLSYDDLLTRATALANAVRERGIAPGSLVALRVRRSAEFVVGVVGILMAGCGYVPVDPAYPAHRQEYVLRDAGVAAVVTPERASFAIHVTGNAAATGLPADIAYVIYTSGSTGAPKGVLVGHRQVLALMSACDERYTFSSDDVWTLFHSPSFDFSVWELWGALLHGGRLVVVPAVSAPTTRYRERRAARWTAPPWQLAESGDVLTQHCVIGHHHPTATPRWPTSWGGSR